MARDGFTSFFSFADDEALEPPWFNGTPCLLAQGLPPSVASRHCPEEAIAAEAHSTGGTGPLRVVKATRGVFSV